MKLIIQIPCLNETATLPAVLEDLPAHIPGIDTIETLVIDDGSTDGTAKLAAGLGVDHVIRHRGHKGLATAFQTGVDACLKLGADIIVNTDGDHQYPGTAIPRLIEPIRDGRADIVIGDRQVDQVDHFSGRKKVLQKVGSWVVRVASDTDVPDAPSGFRAYSREAALRLYVTNDFSYTVENLIQAGKRRLTIAHTPIDTNPQTRPPRLHKGNWSFVKQQASTIVRTFTYYEPLRTFSYLAAPFFLAGLVLLGRFFYVYALGNAYQRLLQSVTIGASLVVIGFLIFVVGLLADAVANHRRLTEELLYRVRSIDSDERIDDLARRLEALERELTLARDGNKDR
ncbi:MAG: Undecaprenyl-phosphate mannosyltransferase [Anaerolineales bacterium]|nr:Undecaprenyl-phosphate mannosyltransferase [Anaerolineales bacterium]